MIPSDLVTVSDLPHINTDKPTLRDQFAMAALTGWLADSATSGTEEEIAQWCYEIADAMMKERTKPT